ncbi:MAG: hypothetical protein ACOXZH_02020 [Bacteroidales bacterium]|jgi:hypothetical protein|nr:hypothetical protein [Bacteroidales bacterium]
MRCYRKVKNKLNFSCAKQFFIFFFSSLFFIQCQSREPATKEENDSIVDPIETYSLIKSDPLHGITIVSLTEENPLAIREKIFEYEIPETTFEAKRKKFYELLNALELLFTFSEHNIYNIVDSLNYMAAHYLRNILEDPKSVKSSIKHKMLTITTSADKNLRVFSWDENAGMSFKTHINVLQYRTPSGKLKSFLNESMQSDNDYNFTHATITAFYRLNSSKDNPMYLSFFKGSDCKNCLFEGITAIKITEDSLIFDYPIFCDSLSYLIFNYSADDKFQLNYNPKSKVLFYQWIQYDENMNDTLSEEFIFSDNYFYKKENE